MEIGEAWVGSVETRLDPPPNDEERCGRAVVRACACILGDATAEFTEGKNKHPSKVSLRFQIGNERRECGIQIAHKAIVGGNLIGVRVEPALGNVIHPRGKSSGDESTDQIEAVP